MSNVTVRLADELEEFVAVQVATEGFTSASEYLLSLVQRARQAKERAALEAKLLAAHRSLERGEGKLVTPEYWQQVRAEIRERYGEGDAE